MEIIAFMQALEALLAAAPQIEAIAIKGKEMIDALFAHGVISKFTQDSAKARVDAVCAARLAGVVPSHWQVEADPT